MLAVVKLMRIRGQRLARYVDEQDFTYEGNLHTASLLIKDERYEYATLRTGLPTDVSARLPPDLFEPVLVCIGNEGIFLRGYEGAQGTGFVQEWYIVPKMR
jgi:hypothetical protein